jgi:serine/threonine-protein kinase
MHSPEFVALQDALAGRFSLERELGRGGMGIVFLARDVALERPVAIKLLPPTRDAGLRARFLREARTAAGLSHPHIVPVHEVGESGALSWFVMSYVAGESLGDRVRRDGALPVRDVVRIGREVAWALAYAHRAGLVHRDVKPDNILVERATDRALLTDFGIALAVEGDANAAASRTDEGRVMGTARVMSPEQGASEPLDGRSDVYSLGVTLFFALTGRWPIDGATAAAILARHATVTPPDVRTLRADVPPRLAEIVARALQKSPADRFPSADAMVDALGTLEGTVVATAPVVDGFVDQLGALRHEGALAASVIPVLLLQAVAANDGFQSVLLFNVAGYAAFVASGVLGWRGVRIARAARALVQRGFTFAEVRRAIVQRDALPTEPVAVRPVVATSRWERVKRWATAGSALVASGVAWWKAWQWWDAGSRGLAIDGSLFAVLTLFPIAILRWGVPHLLPRDVTGATRWGRRWSGAWGRPLFRWAGAADATSETPALAGDAPTELALGASIHAILRALPPARQAELGDVEALVARLEREGVALRARGEALRATAHGAPEAELLEERRRTVVAAIEGVRLDLLRMHAGGDTSGAVTRAMREVDAYGKRVDEVLGTNLDLSPSGGVAR